MLVELKALRPNPYRDMHVDPIDNDAVVELTKSIREDGFWGGVVARKLPDGTLQIAAGHHRIAAAIKAGITRAEVHVADLDDQSMIRIYARENATQRGVSGTAQAGSIISAIRFIAKALLTGGQGLSTIVESLHAGEQLARALTSDKGIGEPIISRFLAGIPGISTRVVEKQVATLKASGNYARVIAEVQANIEQENREAMKAAEAARKAEEAAEAARVKAEAERKAAVEHAKQATEAAAKARAERERQEAEARAKLAEKRAKEAAEQSAQFDALRKTDVAAKKAAESSAKQEVTFDFEGVAKHLKQDNMLQGFREIVTSAAIKPYMGVSQQAEAAAWIVAEHTKAKAEAAKARAKGLKVRDPEFTVAWMRDALWASLYVVKTEQKDKAKKHTKAEIAAQEKTSRMKDTQRQFANYVYGADSTMDAVVEMLRDWPNELPFVVSDQFKSAMLRVVMVANKIKADARLKKFL